MTLPRPWPSPLPRLAALQGLIPKDPRWFQIAFLGSFLALGLAEGIVPWWEPLTVIPAAALAQHLGMRFTGSRDRGFLSSAITSLGCCLLIRSDVVWVPALCAALALLAKFVVRFRGKHLFNPANLAFAGGMLATSHVWGSPSQWGEEGSVLMWFAALGLMVVVRALRSDVALAYIAFHLLLKLGRVLYLGQRWQVLGHQMAVASLVLFTFFMISDPRTTPDSRKGRVLFAGTVAAVAFFLQHQLWWMNSPVWALFLCAPLVPLFDRLMPGTPHRWTAPREAAAEAPLAAPLAPTAAFGPTLATLGSATP